MRIHLYDFLEASTIEPKKELEKLHYLFSEEEVFFPDHPKITLERFVDYFFFRDMSFRGTYLDVNDIRTELRIRKEDFNFYHSLNEVFLFSELLWGIAEEGRITIEEFPDIDYQMDTIKRNIRTILDKTGYSLHNIGTQQKAKYIIVKKDNLVEQAHQLITDKNVSLAVIEYNRYNLQGNLYKKQAILAVLANYVEPILHSNKLKSNGYTQLQSDAGFLLNNFHIRHNNRTGTKQKDYISTINDEELEKWYDKAYTVMLSVIVEEQNVDTHLELEQLKASHKW